MVCEGLVCLRDRLKLSHNANTRHRFEAGRQTTSPKSTPACWLFFQAQNMNTVHNIYRITVCCYKLWKCKEMHISQRVYEVPIQKGHDTISWINIPVHPSVPHPHPPQVWVLMNGLLTDGHIAQQGLSHSVICTSGSGSHWLSLRLNDRTRS